MTVRLLTRINQLLLFFIAVSTIVISLAVFKLATITPAKYNITVVEADTVYAGQQLHYTNQYCRYVGNNVNTTVIRSLVAVDQSGKTRSSITPIALGYSGPTTNDKGCATAKQSVLLPSNIIEGWYCIRVLGQYSVLPILQPKTAVDCSQPFYVHPFNHSDIETRYNELQQEVIELQQIIDQSNATKTTTSKTGNRSTPTEQMVVAPTPAQPSPIQPMQPQPASQNVVQQTITSLLGIKKLIN